MSAHTHRCPGVAPAGAVSVSARTRPSVGLLVTGLVALLWFLVRVIPKPTRAAYPCQRVAFPLASGFVLWLSATLGSVLLWRRGRALRRRDKVEAALLCTALAAVVALVALARLPAPAVLAATAVPHGPLGVARGIHPGRVAWVHSPGATRWRGTNFDGEDIGDGYWWQSNHTDQVAVDDMVSRAIQALTGESTDSAAWDALFRYCNLQNGRRDVGYQPGEKVAIKINLAITNRAHSDIVDADGNQTRWLGWVGTSPQMIVAVLRQLVTVVGVSEADVTVGDTTAYFPNHYWNTCHGQFPNVHYLASSGAWGRTAAMSSQGTPAETQMRWSGPGTAGTTPDYLPTAFAEAAYLINLPCLKGHAAGVTLCAKNHYGSFIRLPDEAGYYDLHLSLPLASWTPGLGHYRAHVDILGHPALGGRTVLYMIDALYAGYWWEGHPYRWHLPPFGTGTTTDWPSSLLVSQDPVAIDSVGYDFLLAEWPDVVLSGSSVPGGLQGGAEDYLHEAALADNPPSGTAYDPAGTGEGLPSLGAHEHWNNPLAKQYSRNMGVDAGIELVPLVVPPLGDMTCDLRVNFGDIDPFVLAIEGQAAYEARFPNCAWLNGDTNRDGRVNFSDIDPFVALLQSGN